MISVIIPAYNVLPYLERCVKSIVCQTYKDLEIILVNDGSTDGTDALCERLAQTDSRIKVVHKENGGLSDARNAGIDVAKGEFYSFIDGDDYIEPDTYEAMIAEMQDAGVSIVEGGMACTDEQGKTIIQMCPERKKLSKEEAFINLFGTERYIRESSCNKLFRAWLFDHIRYKKGIINEDMELLPRVLDLCDSVVILSKVIYHYIKRPGGLTTSGYSLKRHEAIRIERDIYLMCKEKYPKLRPYASFYELRSLFVMLDNLWRCDNRKEFKKQELGLRCRILSVFIRCNRWKEIRKQYGAQMKVYFIYTLLGNRNVQRLLRAKHFIVGS